MTKVFRKIFYLVLLSFISLNSFAQDIENQAVDVTFLHLLANGVSETKDAPTLYAVFSEVTLQDAKVQEVYKKILVTAEEFYGKRDLAEMQDLSKYDDGIAELRETIKNLGNMPEMKAQAEQALKMLQQQRAEVAKNKQSIEYTYDAKQVLKEAEKVSLGGRLYSSYVDLGNGKFMLSVGPRSHNAETRDFPPSHGVWPDKSLYTWGLLDAVGNLILPFEYKYYGHAIKYDAVFLTHKDKNGVTKAGIVNYKGKTTHPFQYKEWKDIFYFSNDASFIGQNGKLGLIDFSGKVYFPAQFDELRDNNGGGSYYDVVRGTKKGIINFDDHQLKLY